MDNNLSEPMEEQLAPEENTPVDSAGVAADAILSGDELIVPPGDPVATANLISMVDPDKVDADDIEVIAEATGSSPTFVEKVVSLVAKSVEDAEETTVEAATENYSNRVYRLCSRTNFSDTVTPLEGKTMEEKLTEVIDIVPTFTNEVLENIPVEEIASTISQATGADAEATAAILNVAKSHNDIMDAEADDVEDATSDVEIEGMAEGETADDYVELLPDGDTAIEDEDEYQTSLSEDEDEIDDKIDEHLESLDDFTQKNFSFPGADIVVDVADAWSDAKHDIAVAANKGAKQAIKAITRSPKYEALKSFNKVTLQPALLRAEKTISNNPGLVAGAVIAPIGIASLASLISEAVAYKAAADEEEANNNMANAERLDDASMSTAGKSTLALANTARINMSRQFKANFASELYSDENKLAELNMAKQELANGLYELGAVFNNEQGFWTKLVDFISQYRTQFGLALGSTLTFLAPKFVSVNGNRIVLATKEPSFFSKLSNIFNRDPVWIKGIRRLDSYVRENPQTSAASFIMALGAAIWAWAKATGGEVSPYVKDTLAKIKQAELRISTLESELGSDVASDLAVVTQSPEAFRKAFSAPGEPSQDDLDSLFEISGGDEEPVDTLDSNSDWVNQSSESEEEIFPEKPLDNYPDEADPLQEENFEEGAVSNLNPEDSEAKIIRDDLGTVDQGDAVTENGGNISVQDALAAEPSNLNVQSAVDQASQEQTSEQVQEEVLANNLLMDNNAVAQAFSLRGNNMRQSRYFSRWNFDGENLGIADAFEPKSAPQSSSTPVSQEPQSSSEGGTVRLPRWGEVKAAVSSAVDVGKGAAKTAYSFLKDQVSYAKQFWGNRLDKLIDQVIDSFALTFNDTTVSALKTLLKRYTESGSEAAQQDLIMYLTVLQDPTWLNDEAAMGEFMAAIDHINAKMKADFLKESIDATAALSKAVKDYKIDASQISRLIKANYEAAWQAVAIDKFDPLMEQLKDVAVNYVQAINTPNGNATAALEQCVSEARRIILLIFLPVSALYANGKIDDEFAFHTLPEVDNKKVENARKLTEQALESARLVAGAKQINVNNSRFQAQLAVLNTVKMTKNGAAERNNAIRKIKDFLQPVPVTDADAANRNVSPFTVSELTEIFGNPAPFINALKIDSTKKEFMEIIEKGLKTTAGVAATLSTFVRKIPLVGTWAADKLEGVSEGASEYVKDEDFKAAAQELSNLYRADSMNALQILAGTTVQADLPEAYKPAIKILEKLIDAEEDKSWGNIKAKASELLHWEENQEEAKKQGFSRARYADQLNNLRRIKIAMRRYYSAQASWSKNRKNFSPVNDPVTNIDYWKGDTNLELEEGMEPTNPEVLALEGQSLPMSDAEQAMVASIDNDTTLNGCNKKFCGTKSFSKKRRNNPFSRFNFADGEEEGEEDAPVEEEEDIEVEESVEDAPEADTSDAGWDEEESWDEEGSDEEMEAADEEEWDMESDTVGAEEDLPEEDEAEVPEGEEAEEDLTVAVVAPTREDTEVPHWGDENDFMDSNLDDESIMQSEYADEYDSKPGELTLSAANAGEAMAMQNDLATLRGVDQLKGESNFSRSRRVARKVPAQMASLAKLLGDKYIK